MEGRPAVWLANVEGQVWVRVGEGKLKPTGVYWNSSMQVSVQYADGEVTRTLWTPTRERGRSRWESTR